MAPPPATAEQFQYELAERRLRHFIKYAWPHIDPADYVANWHIDAIAEHLEAVADGEIRRLAIMMPPRHMKSLSVNVAFPAWVWAQRRRSPLTGPGVGFLSTSYAQHLSIRDNLKCRRLLDSGWYQWGWGDRFKLTGDQNTKIRFENDRGGYRIASSVDGTATGDGGDIIIIDDPISAQDALSATIRATANEWFDGTMSTRLNDPKTGAYIIIMQRLNEDDLVGHVLGKDHASEWTVLCLPARYERDHPFVYAKDERKNDGELLWPTRMGESELSRLENALGSYGAAGQLQQRPAPRDGGMFQRRWFETVHAAPAGLQECRGWDFAGTIAKPGRDPDWTVGIRIGKSNDGFFYILDCVRFRDTAAAVERSLLATAQRDGKACRIRIPQDPGQAGKGQASAFTRLLAGFIVKAVPPTGSKETRAAAFAAQCEAGNVKVVRGEWNEAFFREIETFPAGKHDDQIDAASDAFNELAEGSPGSRWLATLEAYLASKEPAPLAPDEAEDLGRYLEYIRNTGR
jgi:predicted phage terminase large subunit-like protein